MYAYTTPISIHTPMNTRTQTLVNPRDRRSHTDASLSTEMSPTTEYTMSLNPKIFATKKSGIQNLMYYRVSALTHDRGNVFHVHTARSTSIHILPSITN